MMQHFGPIMNEGGAAVSLTYIASEKVRYIRTYSCLVGSTMTSFYQPILLTHPTASLPPSLPPSIDQVIPGYGGGMSSAKAQLESDTRVLAYEAGRKYKVSGWVRVSDVLLSIYSHHVYIYRLTDRLDNTTRHITPNRCASTPSPRGPSSRARPRPSAAAAGRRPSSSSCTLHCVCLDTYTCHALSPLHP